MIHCSEYIFFVVFWASATKKLDQIKKGGIGKHIKTPIKSEFVVRKSKEEDRRFTFSAWKEVICFLQS